MTNGLDGKAQNINHVQLRKTIAIFKTDGKKVPFWELFSRFLDQELSLKTR